MVLGVGTFGGASKIDANSGTLLARFANTFFAHRIDKMVDEYNYKGIERYFLAGALPWALSRMIPVGLALAFGGGFVTNIAHALNTDWKWLGDGLATAGAVLPAVGFAILLHYLPVKKHFAYLILGFIFTMLFTTLFGNIQTLGTAVAGVAKNFTATFNGLSMLAIALIGFAFAAISYQQSTQLHDSVGGGSEANGGAKAAKKTNDEGEITDDEL